MSTRPWMPLYVNDFRLDTLDLDADQVGVYMILLMIAWRREDGAIPNDMEWLRKSLKSCTANFHGHTFNRIVPALLDRYFVLGEDGKYRNKRLTNERQKADKISAKQKQNADIRWSKPNNNSDIIDATALPSQSQSQSHTQKEDSLAHSRSELFEKPETLPTAEQKPDGWPKDYRDQFWEAYPKKVGKKAAIKTLERTRKSGEVSFETLMAGVRRYRSERPPGVAEQQYTCAAQRWLNEGRWDDEPTHETRKSNGYRNGAPRGGEAILAGVRDVTSRFAQRQDECSDAPEGFDADGPGPGGNSSSDLELPLRVVSGGPR